MVSTYTEQLSEINTAITTILTSGQSINRSGTGIMQANLTVLLAERKRLEPLAQAETAGIDTPVIRYGQKTRSR